MKLLKNVFLLGLLALLLVLAACSGGSEDDSVNDTDRSNDQTETQKENDEEDEDKGAQSAGGDLQYALNTQPPTIDPVMSTATATRDIARHIFEPLVTLDSNYQPQPMLAESWEESDDGLTYTFHLRQGVKFHNGKEMKAEDVVASMERWL